MPARRSAAAVASPPIPPPMIATESFLVMRPRWDVQLLGADGPRTIQRDCSRPQIKNPGGTGTEQRELVAFASWSSYRLRAHRLVNGQGGVQRVLSRKSNTNPEGR